MDLKDKNSQEAGRRVPNKPVPPPGRAGMPSSTAAQEPSRRQSPPERKCNTASFGTARRPSNFPARNPYAANASRPTQPPRPHAPGQPPRRPPLQGKPPSPEHGKDRRLLWLLLSIAAVILLIVAIVLIAHAIKRNKDVPPSPSTPSDHPAAADPSALLPESSDMGIDYLRKIIFVGDSNTAHMRSFGVLPDGKDTKQIWVPESSTLTLDSEIVNKKIVYPENGSLLTIAEAAALKKPEYMVLSLGTNGINALDETTFRYCYKKLIDAIRKASPETKIMVQSIFPVTSWYGKISNETILRANGWLLQLAGECGVRYLDTASVLKDANGALQEDFNSYHQDGYHLNAAAYEKILLYIRTHAYR